MAAQCIACRAEDVTLLLERHHARRQVPKPDGITGDEPAFPLRCPHAASRPGRFAGEVPEQQRACRDVGAHFILPVPEVAIV